MMAIGVLSGLSAQASCVVEADEQLARENLREPSTQPAKHAQAHVKTNEVDQFERPIGWLSANFIW